MLAALVLIACAITLNLFCVSEVLAARTIEDIEITSDKDTPYIAGEDIEVTVTFDNPIYFGGWTDPTTGAILNCPAGNCYVPEIAQQPSIKLEIGEREDWAWNDGEQLEDFGRISSMKFTYRVREIDEDANGIKVIANTFRDGDRVILEASCSRGSGNCRVDDRAIEFPHSAYGPFSDGKVSPPHGKIRFADYPLFDTENTGRLEMFSDSDSDGDGDWGLVCDDSFDADDAEVACRQLGLPTGAATTVHLPDGWLECDDSLSPLQGLGCLINLAIISSRPAALDGLRCDGDESQLTDCSRYPGLQYCVISVSATTTCPEQ